MIATRFISARPLYGARALTPALSVLSLGIVQAEGPTREDRESVTASPPGHALIRLYLGDTPQYPTTRPADIVEEFPFRDPKPHLHTRTQS